MSLITLPRALRANYSLQKPINLNLFAVFFGSPPNMLKPAAPLSRWMEIR
jgi:hypothetical protein